MNARQTADLVLNLQPADHLEECQAEQLAVVRAIHADEAEECRLELPLTTLVLFDPVTGDREVTVGGVCLPSIAGQIYTTFYCVAL